MYKRIFYTHWGRLVRTNIEIDDDLMDKAQKAGGYKTKRAAVEAGLRLIVRVRGQSKIRNLRGRLKWDGDLDKMRADR